jgi:hypothetical protein
MKKPYRYAIIITFLLFVGLAGAFVYTKRGIPFVAEREQWTIGIYEGSSPLDFPESQRRLNPVLTHQHVTDVPAKFVADPFLMAEGDTWYLFFEVYNLETMQGDLAVATSTNARRWTYQQLILDEPFHLSYPYVFKWEGEHYLIPESYEANAIRLYRATEFPTQWEFVATLVDDVERVDPSIVYYADRWWLFAAAIDNATLHLYHADDLFGPWEEHPASPIVVDNPHIARPSGRVTIYEERLYRYTMDVNPPVGSHQVFALEITELTPTTYAEQLARPEPIIGPSGKGWNAQAMHQLDPQPYRSGRWIASVDGFGTYLVFGWEY